jgi:DNA-binding transcriptional regulator GbsR (MarR family)
MSEMATAKRDQEAVRGFIERFADELMHGGFPRMPARVFAALLTTDSSSLTAAELGELLRASPAAVSGGVRYLIQVGMVGREGEPGSRRQHYRVPADVWDELVRIRNQLMARWTAVLREGIEILGPATPAGARMAESVRYFEFVSVEVTGVLARWQEYRAGRDGRTEVS